MAIFSAALVSRPEPGYARVAVAADPGNITPRGFVAEFGSGDPVSSSGRAGTQSIHTVNDEIFGQICRAVERSASFERTAQIVIETGVIERADGPESRLRSTALVRRSIRAPPTVRS